MKSLCTLFRSQVLSNSKGMYVVIQSNLVINRSSGLVAVLPITKFQTSPLDVVVDIANETHYIHTSNIEYLERDIELEEVVFLGILREEVQKEVDNILIASIIHNNNISLNAAIVDRFENNIPKIEHSREINISRIWINLDNECLSNTCLDLKFQTPNGQMSVRKQFEFFSCKFKNEFQKDTPHRFRLKITPTPDSLIHNLHRCEIRGGNFVTNIDRVNLKCGSVEIIFDGVPLYERELIKVNTKDTTIWYYENKQIFISYYEKYGQTAASKKFNISESTAKTYYFKFKKEA